MMGLIDDATDSQRGGVGHFDVVIIDKPSVGVSNAGPSSTTSTRCWSG
jgi:hypothetical protein